MNGIMYKIGLFLSAVFTLISVALPNNSTLLAYQQAKTNNLDNYLPVMERALKEKDVSTFESLMCANIKKNEKNLRKKLQVLMDSFDGKINTVAWESVGTSYEERNKKGMLITQRGVKALIETTKSSYWFYIDCWETINNNHPEETKIRRLTLIDCNKKTLVEIKATNGIYEWHE